MLGKLKAFVALIPFISFVFFTLIQSSVFFLSIGEYVLQPSVLGEEPVR